MQQREELEENKPNLLQISLIANKLNPPILHGAPNLARSAKKNFQHLCSWIEICVVGSKICVEGGKKGTLNLCS